MIIGIGNALVDQLVRLNSDSELPFPKGGMTLTDSVPPRCDVRSPGGSVANTMVALARLGASVAYIGKVADDETGAYFTHSLQASGVEPRLITVPGATSGVATAYVSPDGERTFATHLGVAATMSQADVRPELLQGGAMLYVEGYLVQNHDMVESACRMAKERGMRVGIDLASYNVVSEDLPFFRRLVGQYVDIVFANEQESAAFTQGKPSREALREIASMSGLAVVKLGARGAMARRGDEEASVPSTRVPVVDTTAAGDFFAAGFLFSLTQGASLEQCLRVGTLLSSHVIQVMGTGLSPETWQGITNDVKEILQ